MLTKVFKLPSTTVTSVVQHLEAHVKPTMYVNNKRGTYAPGRNEAWLHIHTPLTAWDENTPMKGHFAPGLQDAKLWKWCQTVCQNTGGFIPNTGLAVYGESGITLHRDSPALTPEGVTINLGPTNFLYSDIRGDGGTIREYTLDPGDVLTFNSKHPHAVPEPQPGRWAIILWRVQTHTQKWAAERFNMFKQQYPHLIG